MPNGKLREALTYPLREYNDAQYLEYLLKSLGMDHFKILLDEESEWERVLSGGEKQKIAIIRGIINKPSLLFLDESFNAMDNDSELASIKLLYKELKDTSIILITHKDEQVAEFSEVISKKKFQLHFENFD